MIVILHDAKTLGIFAILQSAEKNATRAERAYAKAWADVTKTQEFPFIHVFLRALTRPIALATTIKKGLVSDVERDAAAACRDIPSSWHGIVNRHLHIVSAYAKNTTTTKFVNTRASSNA